MNIQQTIVDASAIRGLDAIAKEMGYANVKKGVARLERVLASPDLGMIKPEYDGRYSSEGFVRTLLDVLNLAHLLDVQEMSELHAHVEDERYGYRPWLFVDTNFKRTTQPIFALAFTEGLRRLSLPKALKHMTLQEQIDYLKPFITDFLDSLEERDGEVQMWGKPVCFYCHLGKDHVLKLDLDGALIEDIPAFVNHGGACISL